MLLRVSLPAGSACDLNALAAGFATLHHANHRRLPCTFRIERRESQTRFLVACPPELRALVDAQFYAAMPSAHIERLTGSDIESTRGWHALLHLVTESGSARTQSSPIRNNLDDPLRVLLAVLERLPKSIEASISLTIRPAAERERRRAAVFHRRIEQLRRILPTALLRHYLYGRPGMPLVSRLMMDTVLVGLASLVPVWRARRGTEESATELPDGLLFRTSIVLTVDGARDGVDSVRILRELTGAFAPFGDSHEIFVAGRMRQGIPRRPPPAGLLTPIALAALWHLPAADAQTAGVPATTHRELEPPAWLPTPHEAPDLTVLGESVFRGRTRKCGLLPDDRMRHLVVLGKTGTGKSTLLEQLIAGDIVRGKGVGLVDPHGQLVEAVLHHVPRHRTNDVVLFDAADTQYPVGFNPLRCDRVQDRPLVAAGVLGSFKKLYPEFFGPRMEHVFRNALLACVSVPGLTLVDLQRLLCDPPFRRQIVDRCDDEIVRQFWLQEFAGMPAKLQAEAVAPVQNKVGAFVSNPILRGIVGQRDAKLNLRRVMDRGQILLCSVSKGRIGDDASALLGSLLITGLQLAAMSRAYQPERERRDFFLTVDEFGSFATDSFASILSESRKYRLGLTAAMQYLAQATPATLSALFGNAGSLLAFQCGADDAETLADQLGPPVTAQDVLNVPRYHAYAKLLVQGQPTPPFTVRTIASQSRSRHPSQHDQIRRTSSRRYGRPAAEAQRLPLYVPPFSPTGATFH